MQKRRQPKERNRCQHCQGRRQTCADANRPHHLVLLAYRSRACDLAPALVDGRRRLDFDPMLQCVIWLKCAFVPPEGVDPSSKGTDGREPKGILRLGYWQVL